MSKYLPKARVSKTLLVINIFVTMIYLSWWIFMGRSQYPILYNLLLFGEIYHVCLALLFWHTIWPRNQPRIRTAPYKKKVLVDVFIPVVDEPIGIVRNTIQHALAMKYPKKRIYVLNDGYVAQKDNWQDMEHLAKELGVRCITRKVAGGSKAGNINSALKQTQGDLIAIFDADMAPYPQFLSSLLPFFSDEKIGFVQSPQYYKNYEDNIITSGSWEQQELFFGPIMAGKNNWNAAFICGTNVLIRRSALEQVGGMDEKNIAEDFLTSMFIHQKGWKSLYFTEVLAEGLAPQDLLSYHKQQMRWARGSLEVLIRFNPFFRRHLTWHQRFEYLASSLYYFNGVIVLIDILMPLLFLLFGFQPVASTTTNFALFFIPFLFLNLLTIYTVSKQSFTFKAISFAHASWFLQLRALLSILFLRKMSFAITPKKAVQGNFISLAYPHIIYIVLLGVGLVVGIFRDGFNPSVATNIAWGSLNAILFIPYINASYQRSSRVVLSQVTLAKAGSRASI